MDDLRKDPRFERLPKWARRGIDTIYLNLENAHREIASWQGNTKPTGVLLEPNYLLVRAGARPRYLQRDTTIRYSVRGGDIDVNLRDRGDDPVLELMGLHYDDNRMVVTANSSNLFHIGFAGRARPAK